MNEQESKKRKRERMPNNRTTTGFRVSDELWTVLQALLPVHVKMKTMSEYSYTNILDPDPEEGAYTVTVPGLPGCVTQGETTSPLLFHFSYTDCPPSNAIASDDRGRLRADDGEL